MLTTGAANATFCAVPLTLIVASPAQAGKYIVVFRDDVRDVPGLARVLTAQHGGRATFTYERTIRGPLLGRIAPGMARFDAGVLDGAVNGIAALTRGSSQRLRWTQSGVVQNYAIAFVLGVALVLGLVGGGERGGGHQPGGHTNGP